MNKKKLTVTALLLIVIVVLMSCVLYACNPDKTEDPVKQEEIKATEGLLINNGDFKVVDTSVTTYPRSVTSWTGAKMYSNTSFRDDVTAGVISLLKSNYDANKSKWKDDDDAIWQKLNADGRYNESEDNADKIKNALMIYMPEEGTNADGNKINGPTAYGYTSTSFSLAKGAFYKLSVDVLTHNIGGVNETERGARIYLSSNTYAEFSAIDTKGEWKTYEIYIETSPSSATSLTVMLGLGKYNAYYTKGLTSGYAFFDNVTLEKKTAEEYETAKTQETEGSKTVATTTLKTPNGRFDFGSTTLSSSNAPSSWSLVTGNSGKDDPAPTSLGYNAVINLNDFADKFGDYSPTYNMKKEGETAQEYKPSGSLDSIVDSVKNIQGAVGKNVFMLSQQLMTAQGIRSSRTITVEKNKTYALSVQLYTYGIHGAGVTLVLTGNDGKDIKIKGISATPDEHYMIGNKYITPSTGYEAGDASTNGSTDGWRTYTFYIKGNQFRDYNYNMAIWLGTDGTSDNVAESYQSFTSNSKSTTYRADGTFSNGWVFIDELQLTERPALPDAEAGVIEIGENQTLDCSATDTLRGLIVDLTTENLFGEGETYVLDPASATNEVAPNEKDPSNGAGVAKVGAGAPNGWKGTLDVTDASSPVITDTITEGVVNIASEEAYNGVEGTYPGMPYSLNSKFAYMMHANKESYYEVETATFTVEKNQFYRLSVWVKTVDIASASGAYVYLLDKSEDKDSTLTSFTKLNTKGVDEYLNDWVELTVVIRGANDKNTPVSAKFTLGTGDRWASSTLTKGAVFVANMNMSTITYANFKDTTTGTYVKSVDMSTSYTYTFTNGSFDKYDLDDEDFEAGKPLSEQTKPGTPDDWTVSDKTVGVNDKDKTTLFGGVIALNPTDDKLNFTSSNQATSVTGVNASVFNAFYGDKTGYPEEYLDSLAGPYMLTIGSTDGQNKYALGYSSASLTLSANTYYKLSVYAKTVGATTASVFLSGESSASTGTNYFLIESDAPASDWTKYTFFIEVGNTSVSVKLNLWLGLDVKQASMNSYLENKLKDGGQITNETEDEDKKTLIEDSAKSSGVVFFDNVVSTTIDEDAYDGATEDEASKKISFLSDSFDSLSGTTESRGSLASPNGWTGAVESGLSSSNSKVGIVYADSNYYTTETVEGTEYAKVLGLEYKEDDITVTDEELAEARESGEYEGKTDEQITSALKAKKLIEQKKENWIPVSALEARSGNRMLVINNTVNSAYVYTSASNTLKANSYYEVSVFVKTYGLKGRDGDDTIGANIELYLGSANETGKPFIFKSVKAEDWTEYKFLVQTRDADVTSVTVKLSLGSSVTTEVDGVSVTSGLTGGYAMFDDVTVRKVNGDAYDNATEGSALLKRHVIAETAGKADNPNTDNNETPKNKFNLEYLWWMIPTIVIGLVIIAVVVVFVVRKLRKPGAKKAFKAEKAPVNSEMLDRKRDRYDEGKE